MTRTPEQARRLTELAVRQDFGEDADEVLRAMARPFALPARLTGQPARKPPRYQLTRRGRRPGWRLQAFDADGRRVGTWTVNRWTESPHELLVAADWFEQEGDPTRAVFLRCVAAGPSRPRRPADVLVRLAASPASIARHHEQLGQAIATRLHRIGQVGPHVFGTAEAGRLAARYSCQLAHLRQRRDRLQALQALLAKNT